MDDKTLAPDDRALLMLAAKAAGAEMCMDFGWNPLADDGDALRLAVKLRLDICTEDNDPHPTEDRQIGHVNVWPADGGTGCGEILEPDPCAATRRAIVRAAAQIAEQQNGGSKP